MEKQRQGLKRRRWTRMGKLVGTLQGMNIAFRGVDDGAADYLATCSYSKKPVA
jgi:hypothetical protein